MGPLSREALAEFASANREMFEAHLRALVEIPSISADPGHADDMRRCAEAARTILDEVGAQPEILETRGQPLVIGRLESDPSHPTITIYNHLDVQPANEPQWRTDPFELLIDADSGVYRGRGTTDDKGPALAAMLGAVAAHQAGVPINIQFLWELEEEIGSPNFRDAVKNHAEKLWTDSVVVSDTIWLTRGRPSTPAGLRGMQAFALELQTAEHDLHSGLVGGAARNSMSELMSLVADMFDGRTGDVKIPGFYDDVIDLTVAEAREFARSGFSVETFLRDHKLYGLRVDDPLEVMNRVWAAPTMEVHGMVGGYVGPGIKSSVPARAEVKMSCRLVPNMRTERTLELITEFVHERNPDVKVVPYARLEPYKGRTSSPHADALREAYRFGFGEKPAFTREGGSIGAVPVMEALLEAEVYFLGLSLPEHGYHAPNENFDWEQVAGGIPAFAKYFELVADIPRRTGN